MLFGAKRIETGRPFDRLAKHRQLIVGRAMVSRRVRSQSRGRILFCLRILANPVIGFPCVKAWRKVMYTGKSKGVSRPVSMPRCAIPPARKRGDLRIGVRQGLAMETLGMSLAESNALLEGVLDCMVAQQVSENLEQRRAGLHCGRRYATKGSGNTPVKTLFGSVYVPNQRWNRCACQTEGPETFRPTATWLQGRTIIEMLSLESKWASLIPFAKVADLLTEVLPIGSSTNHESVRIHLRATAERIEQELGQERQFNEYEGLEDEWEQQPLPDGPITVGIDGGYVRAAHKQGCFEIIAGNSVVAFWREDATEVLSGSVLASCKPMTRSRATGGGS